MRERLTIQSGAEGNIWLRQPPWEIHNAHAHDELEFNLVAQGSCSYLIGDRRYYLAAGSLIWLFPFQDHLLVEPSRDLKLWIAVFRPGMVDRLCSQPHSTILREGNPGEGFCRRIDTGEIQRLARLYAVVEEAGEDLPRYNAGLGFLLLETWKEFLDAVPIAIEQELHPAVERAVRQIKDGAQQYDLQSLAQKVGLSPSRLSRLFKQQVGEPIATFRNRLRLQRFFGLYGEGRKMNMLQAALAAGFGSYPQFHRVFRQLMGCGPRMYLGKEKQL